MLNTALAHFNDDIARGRALHTHASAMAPGVLTDDIFRSAWMMAVGACDAYFSDAYADLVSRAIRAKELQAAVQIPDRLNNLKVPVTAVLRQANGGWRWRMAARELMEDQNVLSLNKIRELFNHFFRTGHKLLNQSTISAWVTHRDARRRLFGVTATEFRAAPQVNRGGICADALQQFEDRFETIFQRRHDCIHNCDRPKVAMQSITAIEVHKCVQDIEFLVRRCQDAFLIEFPLYLQGLGFNGATRAQVCQ
jgi:hypothetical protein